jgi:hypothetical protein
VKCGPKRDLKNISCHEKMGQQLFPIKITITASFHKPMELLMKFGNDKVRLYDFRN